MPKRICLMVIAGFQPSSSFNIERQTVPEGYTLGWKSGGTNLPKPGQLLPLRPWMRMERKCLTFRGLGRVFVRKSEGQLEQAAFPDGLLSPWYPNFPVLEIKHSICASQRFREEAERVVTTPLLSAKGCQSRSDVAAATRKPTFPLEAGMRIAHISAGPSHRHHRSPVPGWLDPEQPTPE